MAPRTESIEEKTQRLIAVAREIIHATGDFDLPMRQLAATAQVSLRTPYQLFGSKHGVIRAILKSDQVVFRERTAGLRSENELENLFDRVRLGIDFFADKQPFYRALFRASQGYSGGDETEPARENARAFRILCRRAQEAGLIFPEIDAALLGETLTDIFASNLRNWANSSFDIELVDLKIGFGFSVVLCGVTPEPYATRMRERRRRLEDAIRTFDERRAKSAA